MKKKEEGRVFLFKRKKHPVARGWSDSRSIRGVPGLQDEAPFLPSVGASARGFLPTAPALMDLIEDMDRNDVAQYFHSKYPDAYLWSRKSGWHARAVQPMVLPGVEFVPAGGSATASLPWVRDEKRGRLKWHVSETLQDALRPMREGREGREAHEGREGRVTTRRIESAYMKFGCSRFIDSVIVALKPYYEGP